VTEPTEPIDKGYRTCPLAPVDGPHPNRVQELRIARRLSRSFVARRLHMTSWHLKMLETGHRPLPPKLAARIAEVIQIPVNDLLAPSQGRSLVPVPTPSKRLNGTGTGTIEISIAVDGRLVGGITTIDARRLGRVLKDVFGGET
jgi:transcriptional regulator with XRE-family HTH domain